MIDIAMKFLRDYLTQEIGNPTTVLANITKEDDLDPGRIHLSLIHVEEEKILKEVNHQRRLNGNDFYSTINPEIRLNLYVLVTYQYTGKNYEESLKQLSNVVTTLQGKYVFSGTDFMKPEYKALQQIVVDLYSQSLDQNNTMWQALGEKLSPSLLYKLRVIAIQANRVLDTTGEIRAIGLDVVHKQFES